MYLAKPMESAPPRVNPNVNYGLWVIMMCQCRCTDYTKFTTPVRDADSGGGCACVGQGAYGKFQYPPLSFAVNLKKIFHTTVKQKIK